MSNTFSAGSIKIGEAELHEVMEAFDNLPKEIRTALHHCTFPWSPLGMATLWHDLRLKGATSEQVANVIRHVDREAGIIA